MPPEQGPHPQAGVPTLYKNKENCCGCGGCASLCPANAIVMHPDLEGFLYPHVQSHCTACGQCLSACAFRFHQTASGTRAPSSPKVYSARVKDPSVLEVSSSGGMFTALSDLFLNGGNGVACAVYSYATHSVDFKLVTSKTERDMARGSKYLQSDPGNIYSECVQWLAEHPGKKLLFLGTGCQSAAFQRVMALRNLEDRVCVVDLICHGLSSPTLWRDYIALCQSRHKGPVELVSFRDKRKPRGWEDPTAVAAVHGKEFFMDQYMKLYYSRCALRPACHQCSYATPHRSVDMTIGDHWGLRQIMPDFYDPRGTSLVLCHTTKGHDLFEAAKPALNWRECSLADCLQPNLRRPTPPSERRGQFWAGYRRRGMKYILKQYGNISLLQRLKNALRSGPI